MKKALKLLLLGGSVFCSTLLAGQGKVIFVHGWNVAKNDYTVFADEFISLFSGSQITMHEWNAGDLDFGKSLAKAEAEAVKLADELSSMKKEDRENTILVGHSLGGLIVIKAMAILAGRNLSVDRGIFLGAAIADDDPAIAAAITASKRANINIYHPRDHILRDILTSYNLLHKKQISALGAFGYSQKCLKSRLFQIKAGEYAEAADFDDYAMEFSVNHLLRQYLSSLKENLSKADKVLPGEIDLSTAVQQLEVPGLLPGKDIPLPQPLRYLSKSTLLAENRGWRLFVFRNKEKRFRKWRIPAITIYYIVNPRDRIAGWTMFYDDALNAMTAIEKQLKNLEQQ